MNLILLILFVLMFPLLGLFVVFCLDFFGLVFKSVNKYIDDLTVSLITELTVTEQEA